jgi:hypothetical protein
MVDGIGAQKPKEDSFDKYAQVGKTDDKIDQEKDKETKKDVATNSGGAPMALGHAIHQDSISSAAAPGSPNQHAAIEKIVSDSTTTVTPTGEGQ